MTETDIRLLWIYCHSNIVLMYRIEDILDFLFDIIYIIIQNEIEKNTLKVDHLIVTACIVDLNGIYLVKYSILT